MWKASAGTNINLKEQSADDDWDTDPDFINDVTEQEQRWGSRTVEGSGRVAGTIDMGKLRLETEEADKMKKQQLLEEGPNPSFGYGGKFGVEVDRMDRSAVGHDYVAKVEKHASQKDYSTGFGGKFGVQTDRVDKSAVSWDHREKVEKHASQKDYASGFGGKFGVEKDRQDKSAVGWDHVEKIDKHESQIDYTIGFGGKFGIQADRQDKCAVGWDHHEAPQKHESQLDHKIGFGGKFGVQTDRMDKSAVAYTEPQKVGTNYTKAKPDIGDAKPADLRAKFEHMGDDARKPKEAEPERRPVKQLDTSKTALFADKVDRPKPVAVEEPVAPVDVAPPPSVETTNVRPTEEAPKTVEQTVEQTPEPNREAAVEEEVAEFNVEDTGLVAIALFDYQSAADDEISFDPDDVITHVEMIDEGWWRGLCRGKYGLFPANYVQLHQ